MSKTQLPNICTHTCQSDAGILQCTIKTNFVPVMILANSVTSSRWGVCLDSVLSIHGHSRKKIVIYFNVLFLYFLCYI